MHALKWMMVSTAMRIEMEVIRIIKVMKDAEFGQMWQNYLLILDCKERKVASGRMVMQ